MCVMRYVEGNALRARLVARAEDWRWGSLWERVTGGRELLDPPPMIIPKDWPTLVNLGCSDPELDALRRRPTRGRPRKKGSDPFSW